MLAKPQPVVLTYDDYARLPEDGRRYELLDGEVYRAPAPLLVHQHISRNLEFILHRHVRERGLGEVYYAPVDVILARTTVVQPDLVFVAKARAAILSERGIEGAPDLVVEILSPATAERDQGTKQQLYARHGVQHYWLVDPAAKTLGELILEGAAYERKATYVAPAHVTPALLPELTIDLAEVFGG
jgi:Uma2 family endonuclease